MRDFRLSIIQNRPSFNISQNLKDIVQATKKAKAKGSELVLLSEMFIYPYELSRLKDCASSSPVVLQNLQELAQSQALYICAGSLPVSEEGLLYNRSYFIEPSGQIILSYDKCHLFDVGLSSLQLKESAVFQAGSGLGLINTPLANFGLVICYDIRFPEMARSLALRGAEVLLVPAAFNNVTGPAHWQVILRTRAIENQVFIAAAAPAPTPHASYHAYGHSLIIDPWGKIIAQAGKRPALLFADIKVNVLQKTRERLPLLSKRRPELYQLGT